ncbi:MAG: phosphorelay protein [Alphaproteobacteria bacterium]|nr:phosphorelay protein [Alphaproteobacteria bacterium]MBF0334413.1 phosphorelay protein [Alphaproteobacteria bacterium]
MSGDEPEFIQPPNTLKNKVKYGPDGVDLDMLEKAEQIIANLQGNYLEWVQDDLTKLQGFYDKALATPEGERAKVFKDLFGVAHDVKGQGGSFGYHLMTAIGNQLCRFLEGTQKTGAAELDVVKVHLDAMRLVIGQRMEGDGGKMGENLLRGLQAVVAKVAPK